MLWLRYLLLTCGPALVASIGWGADLQQTQQMYRSGQYRQAMQIAQQEVDRGIWNERWPRLLIQCQLTLGQYEQALQTYENALRRYTSSLPLRTLGREVYRFNHKPALAQQQWDAVVQIAQSSPWRYSDKESLIALGRYFLDCGEDARKVLELFYDRVRNMDAQYVDAYIATGQLALQKHDHQLAAEQLDHAARLQPDDADICFLRSLAWRSADPQQADALLKQSLTLNPHHVDALLWKAEHEIDAEQFERAEAWLQRVLEINPYQARAWALHAVIAHLQGHFEAERMLRSAGLCRWQSNPEVDHLIGTQLSQHYRFAEAIDYQRRALTKQENFAEAKFQLAQDLLRVGNEADGWKLADEVFQQDGYNVVAHNLVNLHDSLKKFTTLESPGFVIRMDAREARIFGKEVVALLTDAHQRLTEKYDIQLNQPTIVEIFPKQSDFAIRTFGLPGGDGFLGVCFGRLITANSPASQTQTPANWKAVLWHEFTHVITLQKSSNRMPRWFSEGISVYEERLQDPSWGQTIDPAYRRMLLDHDTCTPLSELSGAFLQPRSALHLQFAYYESSLAVEYLVQEVGIDGVKGMLDDLAIGMPMHETLQRRVGALDVIDQRFKAFVTELAGRYGKPKAWESVATEDPKPESLDYYEHALQQAKNQIQANEWDEAQGTLDDVARLFEETQVPISLLMMQASVARNQTDVSGETSVLQRIADRSDDAVEVYQRLIQLATATSDWESVGKYARKWIDVNPFSLEAQMAMADAAEHLKQPAVAAAALHSLTEMSPVDPAGLRFRLAKALRDAGQIGNARRQVLMALEVAPKYRLALQFLQELQSDKATAVESK